MLCLLLAAWSWLAANNLLISNVHISGANQPGQYAMVDFDIQWENSWRDATNWDAVWLFVKYRAVGNTGAWSHASLNHVNGTNDGHTAAPGAVITTPSDGKGVFLHRDAVGSGTASFSGNRLRWNFGMDGLPNGSAVDIKVFAIEMVYVPQGSFSLGDGETNLTQMHGNFEAGCWMGWGGHCKSGKCRAAQPCGCTWTCPPGCISCKSMKQMTAPVRGSCWCAEDQSDRRWRSRKSKITSVPS